MRYLKEVEHLIYIYIYIYILKMGRGKMVRKVEDAIQVLKHIKSLKGDYKGYAEHTNSRDIKLLSACCHNLLEDNIPLCA